MLRFTAAVLICLLAASAVSAQRSAPPSQAELDAITQRGRQLAEYDFLGVNEEWKMDWTEAARGHRWLFLFRSAIRPRTLRYLKFTLMPKVKPRLVRLCTSLRGQS